MQRHRSASLSAPIISLVFLACSAWGDASRVVQSDPARKVLTPTPEAASADTPPPGSPIASDPDLEASPSEGAEPASPEPAKAGGSIDSNGAGGAFLTALGVDGACQLADAAACRDAGTRDEPRLLPDLVMDGPYLSATIRQDYVDAAADTCLFNEGCVTGTGLRRVIRFGTRSGNIGTADLVVGKPDLQNPLWEFDACHQHFHFEGYAQYSLIDSASGIVLPIGVKNGFCLRDQERWDPAVGVGAGTCASYDCNVQGISMGCADVYQSDLDCQWVDITGLPEGPYELVVTVNSEQTIEELSHANNSASVRVELTPDAVRILP